MTTSSSSSSSSKSGGKSDAISMLLADHKKVKKLFKDFDKLKESGAADDKQEIVMEICNELSIHAQLEEEIFYPAVRLAIDDDDLMDEAIIEHAGAKELIAQLEASDPSQPFYDAKVTVLGEEIDHHVEEEETEMFVKVKKSKLDLAELGEEMALRKEALMAEMEQSTKGSSAA